MSKESRYCKLTTAGVVLGKKGEIIGLLRYLTRIEAEEELRSQKPGSLLLRIDKDSYRDGVKNVNLVISYKFKTLVFHRPLNMKVKVKSQKKTDEIICTMDPKAIKLIKSNFMDFLKKFVVTLIAVVKNDHWIDKELQSIEFIKPLLSFRDYIIFPGKDRIIVIQKTRKRNEYVDLEIIIDFINLNFCIVKSNTNEHYDIVDAITFDFNNVLLEFLGIEYNGEKSKSLPVYQALGYNFDDFRKEMEDDERLSILKVVPEEFEDRTIIDDNEKEKLISMIYIELNIFSGVGEISEEVVESLGSISKTIKALNEEIVLSEEKLSSEFRKETAKMEWIKRGLLNVLFKIFSVSGKHKIPKCYDLSLEICQNLLSNFPPGCSAFHKFFWLYMDELYYGMTKEFSNYTGIISALIKLLSIPHLRQVFKSSGIARFVSLYSTISKTENENRPINLQAIDQKMNLQRSYDKMVSPRKSTPPRKVTKSPSKSPRSNMRVVSKPLTSRPKFSPQSPRDIDNISVSPIISPRIEFPEDDDTSTTDRKSFPLSASLNSPNKRAIRKAFSEYPSSANFRMPIKKTPNKMNAPTPLETLHSGQELVVSKSNSTSPTLSPSPSTILPELADSEPKRLTGESSNKVEEGKEKEKEGKEKEMGDSKKRKSATINIRDHSKSGGKNPIKRISGTPSKAELSSTPPREKSEPEFSEPLVPSPEKTVRKYLSEPADKEKLSKMPTNPSNPLMRQTSYGNDNVSRRLSGYNNDKVTKLHSVGVSFDPAIEKYPAVKFVPEKEKVEVRQLGTGSMRRISGTGNAEGIRVLVRTSTGNETEIGDGSTPSTPSVAATPIAAVKSATKEENLIVKLEIQAEGTPKTEGAGTEISTSVRRKSSPLSPVMSPRTKNLGFRLNLPAPFSPGPLSPKSVLSPKGELSSQRGPATPKKPVMVNTFRSTVLGELKDLAKKIGETYVSADLTMLLSLKQESDKNKKKNGMETTRLRKNEEPKEPDQLLMQKVDSPLYLVKSSLLVIMANLSSSLDLRTSNRNIINFLYTELMISYNSSNPSEKYESFIFPILQNFSELIENDQKTLWDRITEGMTKDTQVSFRKKMDLLLWRIRTRLNYSYLNEDPKDLTVQLKMLADYIKHSSSRITAAQVADVCLDTMLKIKHNLLSTPVTVDTSIENVELIHELFRAFCMLSEVNSFAPLNDLLLTIFVAKDTTTEWMEHYSMMILCNVEFEKKIIANHSKLFLESLRLQVVNYYISCVEMIHKQFKSTRAGGDNTKLELIQKMEFLIYPNSGVIQMLFSQNPPFLLAKAMLTFLHKVLNLRDKDSPLMTDFAVDCYISYHYVQFLRLYHNYSIDGETLVLCRKHLRILTDYAAQKNEKIKQKFYQLKVMDFLTREISLEYEVKVISKNISEDMERQKVAEKPKEKKVEIAVPDPVSAISKPPVSIASPPAFQFKIISKDPKETITSPTSKKPNFKLHFQGVELKGGGLDPKPANVGLALPTLPPKEPEVVKTQVNTDASTTEESDEKNEDTESSNNTDASEEESEENSSSQEITNESKTLTKSTEKDEPLPPKSQTPSNLSGSSESSTSEEDPEPSNTTQTEPTKTGQVEHEPPKITLVEPPNTTQTELPKTDQVAQEPPKLTPVESPNTTKTEQEPPKTTLELPKPMKTLEPIKKGVPLGGWKLNVTGIEKGKTPVKEIPFSTPVKENPIQTPIKETPIQTPFKETPAPEKATLSVPGAEPTTAKKGVPMGGWKLNISKAPEATKVPSIIEPKSDVNKKPPPIKLPPMTLKGNTVKDDKGTEERTDLFPKPPLNPASSNGFLSQMESAMQSENVKKIEDFLTEQSKETETHAKEDEIEDNIYRMERVNRKFYYDDKLHIGFLELVLMLLISPNGFTLDSLYTNQYPLRILKHNILYILGLHLNHKTNATILGGLTDKTHKLNASVFRMFKLLSNRFFEPSMYTDLVQFAKGAYGIVYGAKLLGEEVAVKQLEVPKSIKDRCVAHDIFTEITILDRWKADGRICKLIDFGVDDLHYWIVMKRYSTSLRDWRDNQTKSLKENLLLYLNIYADVLQAARFLEENMVNHYDIKCDNFLIYPTTDPTLTKHELYNQTSDIPNFSVCLADFGESLVYTNKNEGYLCDNRGTEFIKSPEMLTVAYANKVDATTYDRRKQVGAGPASDIWSLGCLFYELLVGDFLFYEADWVKFFLRVTTESELLPDDKLLELNHDPELISFLKYVLNKNRNLRPKISDVITGFGIFKDKIVARYKKEDGLEEGSPQLSSGSGSPMTSLETLPPIPGGKVRSKGKSKKSKHTHLIKKSTPESKEKLQRDRKQQMKQKQEEVLASIKYKPSQFFDISERKYMEERPTKITNYLYLGSHSSTVNKTFLVKKYMITHIVNTAKFPELHPEVFIYHNVKPPEGEAMSNREHENPVNMQVFMDFFEFVTKEGSKQGRILVLTDESGFGVALVLGFLIYNMKMKISFLEAFQFVQSKRYDVHIDAQYIHQLIRWEKEAQSTFKEVYQCLCGANVWTLLLPFDTTEHQNPVTCNCTIGESYSGCPNHGCGTFCKDMESKFPDVWRDRYLHWGHTTKDNIRGNFDTCEEHTPLISLDNAERAKVEEKFWNVYKCRRCQCLCKAENSKDPSLIAIVTNRKKIM